MQEHKKERSNGGMSGDPFRLAVPPLSLAAPLMIAVGRNYLHMCATTVNVVLNEISARQNEALRALKSAAMLSFWPLIYLANSAVIVEPRRIFAEQRTSAVVINFPDRRKPAR